MFCPRCGAPVRTGLERVVRPGEGFWIPRIIAFIIDSVIVGLAMAIITIIATLPFLFFRPRAFVSLPSLLTGLLSVAYFTLMERFYGFTIGKMLLGMRVESVRNGLPNLGMAFIRNVSKIHWGLLLLDFILGLITPGEPSQKFSDRYAGTMVQRT